MTCPNITLVGVDSSKVEGQHCDDLICKRKTHEVRLRDGERSIDDNGKGIEETYVWTITEQKND